MAWCKRIVLSLRLLSCTAVIYLLATVIGYSVSQPTASDIPVIIKVSPNEVYGYGNPVKVSIFGRGFKPGVSVQLLSFGENPFRMDIVPIDVNEKRIDIIVTREWFLGLERYVQASPDTIPIEFFFVKAIAQNRVSSNLFLIKNDIFLVRIVDTSPKNLIRLSPVLHNELLVTVVRRGWNGPIPLKVVAFSNFDTVPVGPNSKGGIFPLAQINGIEGYGTIPPGQNSVRIPINVASFVPSGAYNLHIMYMHHGNLGGNFCSLQNFDFLHRQCGPFSLSAYVYDLIQDKDRFDCVFMGRNCPPLAPTNLTVIDTSPTSVSLRWIDNADNEEAFEVQRWEVTDGDYSSYDSEILPYLLGSGGENFWEVWELDPATYYCFVVSSWNPYGSPSSEEVCATTDEPEPPAPASGLSITYEGESVISIAWFDNQGGGVSGEEGFRILRKPPGGSWATIETLDSNPGTGWMEYDDTGLSPSTEYCYKVKIFHDFGFSNSSPVCGETDDTPPPPPGDADLSIDSISCNYTNCVAFVGETLEVTIEYCNDGESDTGPFKVGLKISRGVTVSVDEEYPASNVAPGDCEAVSWEFPLGVVDDGEGAFLETVFYIAEAEVDIDDEVEESSESNNDASRSITVHLPCVDDPFGC